MKTPAYIINLPDATERWESAAIELERLCVEYERFPAMDGRTVPGICERHQDRGSFFCWSYDLSPTEIGCFLSHLRLWEHIAEGNPNGAFVFEDDFKADDSLADVIAAIANEHIRRPVMIKLFDNGEQIDAIHTRTLVGDIELVLPYGVPYTTVAYYVNNVAAQKLARKFRRRKFRRPVDDYLRHRWTTGVRVWVVRPSPVGLITDHLRTSAIEAERRVMRRNQQRNFRLRMFNEYSHSMNRLYISAVRAGLLRWGL